MKRTNTKKGRNEDPGWVEISWERSDLQFDIMTAQLKPWAESSVGGGFQ